MSDLRFVVLDGKTAVLGLPVTAGQDQPTREGYMIPSEGLSEILASQFDSKWASGVSYDDYIGEVLKEIKSHNPNVSDKLTFKSASDTRKRTGSSLGSQEQLANPQQ